MHLDWVTGGVLLLLLIGTVATCVHAGGHAFFAPLPAVAVAAAWAILAASRHPSVTAAWSLAGASAALSGAAVLLGGAALAQRRSDRLTLARAPGTGMHARPGDIHRLPGADGVAITAMTPSGVVRVAGETWSGRSLSGPLPAGATIHVVSVEGLSLHVWSEAGSVPASEVFESGGVAE
jgi:membrane-bound ClpP family serine protease